MGFIRERILKNGEKRFQSEIRLKGYKTMTATFNRRVDAKAWIQKTEADIRCGRHQLYSESKKYIFKDAVKRYLKERKVSTVKRGHLLWWQKELGHLYLQDIRPAIIAEKKQKLLSEATEKGVIRTGSTCNRYLATLSHLMSMCEKQWEWIATNPVKKITREKEPRERTRFLNPKERSLLLQACQNSDNPYLFLFVVLLLSTGCRYNEIRLLKWSDVDLCQGRITITKSKNHDIRTVPVRGLALKLLKELFSTQASIGYIFPSKNNKKPLDLRRALRTAIKRAGLKNFRAHDCRHSYATEMLAMGLSLGEIGHLLGHRSVSMTRRYAHLVESRSVDAVTKMTEEIFKEDRGNGSGPQNVKEYMFSPLNSLQEAPCMSLSASNASNVSEENNITSDNESTYNKYENNRGDEVVEYIEGDIVETIKDLEFRDEIISKGSRGKVIEPQNFDDTKRLRQLEKEGKLSCIVFLQSQERIMQVTDIIKIQN